MLCRTLPYLVLYNFTEDVACAFVLWFTVDVLHVLKSGLGDVDRHGDADGDDAAQHGRDEVGRGTLGK